MTRTLTEHYLEDARAILRQHRPGEDGTCIRCRLNHTARRWPCAAATFAQRALELLR